MRHQAQRPAQDGIRFGFPRQATLGIQLRIMPEDIVLIERDTSLGSPIGGDVRASRDLIVPPALGRGFLGYGQAGARR